IIRSPLNVNSLTFFFSSRRRHTRSKRDWSSDVCSSDLFWAEQARTHLTWETDFDQVLDWSEAPVAKWFLGGRLNAAVNCVDRHRSEERRVGKEGGARGEG